MKRLTSIEGLRGYLSIWVLLSHVLLTTGYCENLEGRAGILTNGPLAVKCFMAISGFVIVLLLDSKRESYKTFITRRLFRIYPVYLVLFALSIPCSFLWKTVFFHTRDLGWFSPIWITVFTKDINNLWPEAWLHIPIHLLLLHGLVPNNLLPGSATAFLEPAWSLSLEWQFYLVAPICFYLISSKAIWKRMIIYCISLVSILFSRRFLPNVEMEAALPFQVGYFFWGGFCYFLYRSLNKIEINGDWIFPVASISLLAAFRATNKNAELIPLFIWISFFALLLEPASSISSRYFTPLFSNPISIWLGKISYGIYLSHTLVIIVIKWFLLKVFPDASQSQHLFLLAPLTIGITILVSLILYHAIEKPFIRLGLLLTGNDPIAPKTDRLLASTEKLSRIIRQKSE